MQLGHRLEDSLYCLLASSAYNSFSCESLDEALYEPTRRLWEGFKDEVMERLVHKAIEEAT